MKASTLGKLAQALRQRDQAEQRRCSDRQRPQGIEPAPADPDAWRDSLLWGHPVIETDAIVRIAEPRAERLGRRRLRVRGHRAIAFCHRSRLAWSSVAKLGERRAFVKGDVLGLAALDLVLRRFRARMVRVAVNVEIARMDANDRAADAPGLGIPAHMIANLEIVLSWAFRAWWCDCGSVEAVANQRFSHRIMRLKARVETVQF